MTTMRILAVVLLSLALATPCLAAAKPAAQKAPADKADAYKYKAPAQAAPAEKAPADTAPPSDGFDASKLQTLGAVVTQVRIISASSRNGYLGPGVELYIQSGGEGLQLPLGPVWFTNSQPVSLVVGDSVEVTGMRPSQKKPLFLVSEIKKEDKVAIYRDADGNLLWQHARSVNGPKSSPRPQPIRQR